MGDIAATLQSQPPLLPWDVKRTDADGNATPELVDFETKQNDWFRAGIVRTDQRVEEVSAAIGDISASVTEEHDARVAADAAEAAARLALAATVSSNTAAISTESTARASADGAISATLTSLSTTVGGHETRLGTLESVTPDEVRWQLQASFDGVAGGGISFTGVRDATDGAVYDITFVADQFRLYDPGLNAGAPTSVFSYSGGVFTFNVPVRVQTGDLASNAVNAPYKAAPSARGSVGQDGNWTDIATVTIVGSAGSYGSVGYKLFLGAYRANTNSNSSIYYRVLSDNHGSLTGDVYVAPSLIYGVSSSGDPLNGFDYLPVTGLEILDDTSSTDTVRLQVRNANNGAPSPIVLWWDPRSRLIVEVRKA